MFALSALAVGLVQVVDSDVAGARVSCAASKVDVVSAAASARSCGGLVEVLQRRTSWSRTLIDKDGSAVTDHFVEPRWVRQADGSWSDLDPTLRVEGGTVVPAATLLPVGFSAGGTGPLATLSDGGHRLSMTWSGRTLPAPRLSGATATYEEVLAGVDLRVTALAQGFSEVLVVKSAQAAANLALAQLPFDLSVSGLTLATAGDGGVDARDASGAVVFSSPRAMMWDTADPASPEQAASPPSADRAVPRSKAVPRMRAMGETLSGTRITIVPDQGFLTDPATRYPVYIDPIFTGGKSSGAWAVVASRSDLANSTFWKTTFMNNSATYGDAGSGLTCDDYSGNTCNSTPYKVRSLFRMETYGAAGATVVGANFEITQKWSWTCNTASDAKVWVTGGFTTNVTWNNQPSWDGSHTATAPGNHAVGSPAGCAGTGTVSFDATSLVQHAFSQGWSDVSLGLQAVSEGTNLQWKRFDSATAVLRIHYDHAPSAPSLSDVKVGPDGLTSCGPSTGAQTRVNTTNGLTFNAILNDVDGPSGDLIKAEWLVYGVAAQYLPPIETAGLTSGSNHQTTIPAAAFTNGTWVSFQVRGIDTDSLMAGGWSPGCYLLVDNTAPRPPSVSATDLALRVGLGIVPGAKPTAVVGRSATVTFTADPADAGAIAGFRYGVAADTDAIPTVWVAAGADGTASAPVVPLDATFYNSVVVSAVKSDGTVGASTSARFRANPATGTPHVLGDATGDGRADVTLLSDVGADQSVLWRWDSTPAGGALSTPLAPQGNTGIYPNGSTPTATGDFDGDGLADVATFATSGTDVTVTVQRSDANQLLSTPVLRTMTGWTVARMRAVAGGDVNGDGLSDIVVAYDNGNVSWTMYVLLSASTPGTVSLAAPAAWYQYAANASDPAKVKLVVGDFNGDARTDVAQFYDYGNAQTKLWVHWSQTNSTFTGPNLQWDSGANAWFWGDSTFVAGDFTGDGKTDIAAVVAPNHTFNGTTAVVTFTAKADGSGLNGPANQWNSAANTWNWDLVTPQAGDFDGDAKADLALAYGCCGPYQRSVYTLTSTGASFTAPTLRWQAGIGPLSGGSLTLDSTGTVKYQLRNVYTGKCLDIRNASTSSGTAAQQWTCGATATNQQFTVGRVGATNVYLRPVHAPGQCLAVPGGLTTDGAGIGQWACGTAPDQYQQLEYVAGAGDNTIVRIKPTHSGKCVAVSGGSSVDGTAVIQWPCLGYPDQTWYLRTVA